MILLQSHSVRWIAVATAVVILLVIAGFRFFGTGRPVDVADAEPEKFDTPYVIRSIPSKAKIFVNNEYVALTPYEYEDFDPGILRIRLEHEGLAPVETLLIVREGAPIPIFDPFEFSIPVELVSVPSGAQPIVRGRALRSYEIASFTMRATDTAQIAFSMPGEKLESVTFSPLAGVIDNEDTLHWQWSPPGANDPARLTRVFASQIRVASEPPGAAIYVDHQTRPVGYTNGPIHLSYGEHTLTLRLEPFEDFVVPVRSGHDRAVPITATLLKSVSLTAVDATNPYAEVRAKIEWIRQNGQYVVNPDDQLMTPARAALEGRTSEIKLTAPGFADTTILLDALSNQLHIGLRPLARDRREQEVAGEGLAWVRFVVKQGGKQAVVGAEVFGVDKDDGKTVRFGPTDDEGILITRVPIGDYDWWAAKEGFVAGRPNGERIKSGRKTKEITLKVKPM